MVSPKTRSGFNKLVIDILYKDTIVDYFFTAEGDGAVYGNNFVQRYISYNLT